MYPLKDNLVSNIFPLATFILIAMNVVAFAIELFLPCSQEQFNISLCAVPSNIMHVLGSGDMQLIAPAVMTIITSMFLHGGCMHLFGNMVFLHAFGRNVEARMGPLFFTLAYILSGCWGTMLHVLTHANSHVPLLGASGAVAFVLGAYLIFYPRAQFSTLIVSGIPIIATIRAYWLLPAWFLAQLFSGFHHLVDHGTAASSVAYWVHITGFLCGLAIGGAWLTFKPNFAVSYVKLP